MAWGKFACFFKNDWSEGLGRLAKCIDSKLKELAEKDLSNPKGGLAQLALANGWWDYAQKQTGYSKRVFQSRAAHWYRQAVPEVAGLEKTLAQKRIIVALGAPEDALYFEGHGYFHSDAKLNWHEAKLVC